MMNWENKKRMSEQLADLRDEANKRNKEDVRVKAVMRDKEGFVSKTLLGYFIGSDEQIRNQFINGHDLIIKPLNIIDVTKELNPKIKLIQDEINRLTNEINNLKVIMKEL